MSGSYPNTFLSSKIHVDGNFALRAVAFELHDPHWSARRSKEGQLLCNSISKPNRATEVDRVLSLPGRARAGWFELPEQEHETQLEGLKDVFLNPDEFLAQLGITGSFVEHCSLYALTTELQRPNRHRRAECTDEVVVRTNRGRQLSP